VSIVYSTVGTVQYATIKSSLSGSQLKQSDVPY